MLYSIDMYEYLNEKKKLSLSIYTFVFIFKSTIAYIKEKRINIKITSITIVLSESKMEITYQRLRIDGSRGKIDQNQSVTDSGNR